MNQRQLYLDRGVGETRAVVTLDERPERLLIRRAGEPEAGRLGARLAARVRKVEPALGSAFLDLGEGLEALSVFKPDARPVDGQLLEVEIRTEARRGKLATVRILGAAEGGGVGLRQPAPTLEEQLQAFAREVEVVTGPEARQAADEAEAEALAIVHPLPGGGSIAVEPTRALTAIDVDLGERKAQDAKRATRQANMAALAQGARLLRLKGLGGIVVFDLAGRGHDAVALLNAARAAFAPDNPGVAIGPVSKFGTLELTVPRRHGPVLELLTDSRGSLTDQTLALRLIRRIEDEGRAQRGARLTARCAPAVAEAARAYEAGLADRIGARFALQPDARLARTDISVGVA
jgi:Ribonuclease G/E